MFFVTLRTKGGHFDPPANSETKEAITMKFCTVIAYYNTSIMEVSSESPRVPPGIGWGDLPVSCARGVEHLPFIFTRG